MHTRFSVFMEFLTLTKFYLEFNFHYLHSRTESNLGMQLEPLASLIAETLEIHNSLY